MSRRFNWHLCSSFWLQYMESHGSYPCAPPPRSPTFEPRRPSEAFRELKRSLTCRKVLCRPRLQYVAEKATADISHWVCTYQKIPSHSLTDLKSKREKVIYLKEFFSVKTTVSSLNFIPRSSRRWPIKFCGSLCSAQAWELNTWRAQAFYADTDSLETHWSLNVESVRSVEWERFFWTEHFWIFVVGLFQSYSFQHELGIRSW